MEEVAQEEDRVKVQEVAVALALKWSCWKLAVGAPTLEVCSPPKVGSPGPAAMPTAARAGKMAVAPRWTAERARRGEAGWGDHEGWHGS